MDTPDMLVCNGKAIALAAVVGPISAPKIEKIEPCAMAPPGSNGGENVAAFTIPFGLIRGAASRDAGISSVVSTPQRSSETNRQRNAITSRSIQHKTKLVIVNTV